MRHASIVLPFNSFVFKQWQIYIDKVLIPPSYSVQFFVIFMQFLGKFDQINGGAPPFGIFTPPLGNPRLTTVKILENIVKNNLFNKILARLSIQSI